jgi:hypothetical protein
MEVKVTIDGVDFTVADVTEAAKLYRELKLKTPLKAERKALTRTVLTRTSAVPNNPPSTENERDNLETALKFLMTIAKAEEPGANANDIGRALGVKHLRGIGGKSIRVNKILARLGFKNKAVYTTWKGSQGRFWVSGPNLIEAVKAMNEKLNTTDRR